MGLPNAHVQAHYHPPLLPGYLSNHELAIAIAKASCDDNRHYGCIRMHTDAYGSIRMPNGCIRMHTDAYGCIRMPTGCIQMHTDAYIGALSQSVISHGITESQNS